MKKYHIVLNGQFFIQKTTGQQRYAKELLSELDKIISKNEIIVVVPKCADVPNYKNIKIVRYGFLKNRLWEQVCLPFFLWRTKTKALSFCNTTPFLCPGPTVIHDTIIQEHPEFFTTIKGKIVRFYYNLIFKAIARSGFPIITVTEYSKNNINRIHEIPLSKIFVISNSWQHFKAIKENADFFNEHKQIKKGAYYFALGSLAKQKNFEWIYKNASLHLNQQYIIAGKTVKNFALKNKTLANVLYLGYIPDEDIKALMAHCKAFIFPSLEEGFGIPPLEALSVGATVVASDSSCLPEVLGNAVHYINPNDYRVDLDKIISLPLQQAAEEVLCKYSWKKSASFLYGFINQFFTTETEKPQS